MAATERNIRLSVETIIRSHTDVAYHVEYHAVVPWFQSIDQCRAGVTNLYVTESYFLGTD